MLLRRYVFFACNKLKSHLIVVYSLQARKRQLIDQRLQDKLKKETDSVRRAEESKKEKQVSNRKEEELQLKDSIVSVYRTRFTLQTKLTRTLLV